MTHDIPEICAKSVTRHKSPSYRVTHARIDHEPEDVLNIVERKYATVGALPKPLIVATAALDQTPQFVDILRVVYRDLDIRTLLVALKPEQVLAHDKLDRLNSWSVACHLGFDVGFEHLAVLLSEIDRRCDI